MQRLIRAVCAIAKQEIGPAQAERIGKNAQLRYEALCIENRTDSKALKSHTFKRIYPAIAVYEAMRAEGIPQEQAVRYVHEYFQRAAIMIAPHLQRMIRFPGLAQRIPKIFMRIARDFFPPEAGFAYEYPPSQGNEARVDFVRCPYFEACRRYGCPEITRAFCDSDDTAYGSLHPKLIWGRTKTIGRGDDRCDFLMRYED